MKKIGIYIVCLVFLIIGSTSCDDNTDFSKEHIFTQDEMDEIHRQDSIRDAQKNSINADLKLEYTVNIIISQSAYDGAPLSIETNKIAELFGISEADLLAGIEGETGAPEIKGFAIEGSTHADVGTASNTNSPWGHWWDINGDVTTWGADAMVFAEFDTETGVFSIGQYPGHLQAGQTLKIIECLKYNEKRVAVIITIEAKEREEIKANIVNTQELSIHITPRSDYDQVPLEFDLAQTLSDLGIASMDQVQFLSINEDGSYAQEPTTVNGYWYDLNGFVVSWGDNAKVYTSYGDEDADFDENNIGIGQMPDALEGGETITLSYGFFANNKIEMLKITIHVITYEDPETTPAGDPGNAEVNISLSKPWSNDYASVQADIKDILRETFKMTTYQIHQAIVAGELKVYINTATAEEPQYTADVPGYWITPTGEVGSWAESSVWCSIGHDNTNLYLYGGNHPDNAVAGDTITTKMIVVCNGGQATFNITFTIN